jgi:hypothetical protein
MRLQLRLQLLLLLLLLLLLPLLNFAKQQLWGRLSAACLPREPRFPVTHVWSEMHIPVCYLRRRV